MNNISSESKTNGDLPPLSMRPEQAEDKGFLYEVFASTRAEELALTNWDVPTRRMFLDHQFKAMCQGYRSMFPSGNFSVIELAGQPVGRIVTNRSAKELRVVDVALLPPHQNRGIGTQLMRQVCAEAAAANLPVRLCVLKNNRALHWYARLGFSKIAEESVYEELEWKPSGPS